MNKRLATHPLLLLAIIGISCTRQNASHPSKGNVQQDVATSPVIQPLDNDPYFTPVKEITSPFAPRQITRNIMQDKNGNMWFASWEGIICYDGRTFTNYTNKAGLRRYHVFSTLEDRSGNLWFGTIGAGAYRYDGTSFTNFTTTDGLANNLVLCIAQDKNGNIWFGTDGGASCYDGASFHNFTTKEGLPGNSVNAITPDKTGKIWIGTFEGACFYDPKSTSDGRVIFTNFANKDGSPIRNVRSIIEDKTGKIWLGSEAGLCCYDGKSLTSFPMNFVGYVFEDKKGNIWLSTRAAGSRGMVLGRIDEKTLSQGRANFTTLTLDSMNLDQVFGIAEDKEGNIWFGSAKGVCRYDGKTFEFFEDEIMNLLKYN